MSFFYPHARIPFEKEFKNNKSMHIFCIFKILKDYAFRVKLLSFLQRTTPTFNKALMSNLKEAIKSVLTENEHKISYSKSVGVDGINGEKFLYGGDELKIIGRKIDGKCYKFSNYKENLIVKRHNSTRQISIPTQRDKLVLQGLLKVLQKDFPICNTSAINKIIDIKNNRNNYDSFIKITTSYQGQNK